MVRRERVVRVGGIDYLNALPLTRYLREDQTPPLKVSNHVPSDLAQKLREGELDIALVPVVEYLAREEYRILPGICIASYGEVRSIRLYHSRPLSEVRTVGLDVCSLTSAMLTRVFFRDLWRGSPSFREVSPQQAKAVLGVPDATVTVNGEDLDAVLLIGDAALAIPPRAGWEVVDLGTEWTRWTGLPCIYAFWVWRGGPSPAGLVEVFERAKDAGLARIDDIVASLHLDADFDAVSCRHYLNRVIQYDLGQLQLEGLLEFYKRLKGLPELLRHGLADEPANLGSLRWLDAPDLAPA